MLNVNSAEAISFSNATVYILHATHRQSIGFLQLQPLSELERHNRPVEEWLVQVEGISIVNLYENDKLVRQVTLKRGDSLRIPAHQFHQHTNSSYQESLTSWHFDGDIMQVINKLRA